MTNPEPDTESERVVEREQTADVEPTARTRCPECEGRVVGDGDRGEVVCADCGLVVEEEGVDHGPEWRAFDADERDEKSRVGAPTRHTMHDRGLSTTIGWRDRDAHGRTLPARKRERLGRLRRWDERFRTKDASERNLKQAFGEIQRMSSALGLPETVRETAGVVYRRAVEEGLLPGRSIEGMATASLYAAARQGGTPRQLRAFADVSRVEKLRVQRAYRYLSRELGLRIEPETPGSYVPQFASALEVNEGTERLARELLDVATAVGAHSGKSPAGLAAAALYAAARLSNESLTQGDVADVVGVSRVTIRNRYQELLDVYGEEV